MRLNSKFTIRETTKKGCQLAAFFVYIGMLD